MLSLPLTHTLDGLTRGINFKNVLRREISFNLLSGFCECGHIKVLVAGNEILTFWLSLWHH